MRVLLIENIYMNDNNTLANKKSFRNDFPVKFVEYHIVSVH